MRIRIITASILIALVAAWLYAADFAQFTLGALVLYAVGAKEMGALLGFKSPWPFLLAAALAASVLFYLAPPGLYVEQKVPKFIYYLIALSIPFWIIMLVLVTRYPEFTSWINNKVLGIAAGLFLLVPFLEGLLVLRAADFNENYYTGANLVLGVMALVWAVDSGGYFTGYAIGKTKLLEAVSPKKTREGFYGGIAAGCFLLLIFDYTGFYGHYSLNRMALMAAGLGAIFFCVLGDLTESMLKRMAGIKDSGRLFPGHGGMLDRIDSQLAAIPVFISFHALVSGELIAF